MSKMKKWSLIALALVIIGGIGCLLTFRQLTLTDPISKEKVITKTFSHVVLDSDNASIEIKPTTEKEGRVVLSGKMANKNQLIFNSTVEDKTLSVKLKDKSWPIFDFDFLVQKISLKVYLPEKQYESMNIRTSNGKVYITQINSTKIVATSNNGMVVLKNTHSKKVHAETDNGKVALSHVGGDITGDTNNGVISVITKDLDRPMKFTTDNGRINIQTDKEPTNTRFQVHVDNGRINILDKYNGNAIIGDGENLIDLSTDNGSITVTK